MTIIIILWCCLITSLDKTSSLRDHRISYTCRTQCQQYLPYYLNWVLHGQIHQYQKNNNNNNNNNPQQQEQNNPHIKDSDQSQNMYCYTKSATNLMNKLNDAQYDCILDDDDQWKRIHMTPDTPYKNYNNDDDDDSHVSSSSEEDFVFYNIPANAIMDWYVWW